MVSSCLIYCLWIWWHVLCVWECECLCVCEQVCCRYHWQVVNVTSLQVYCSQGVSNECLTTSRHLCHCTEQMSMCDVIHTVYTVEMYALTPAYLCIQIKGFIGLLLTMFLLSLHMFTLTIITFTACWNSRHKSRGRIFCGFMEEPTALCSLFNGLHSWVLTGWHSVYKPPTCQWTCAQCICFELGNCDI